MCSSEYLWCAVISMTVIRLTGCWPWDSLFCGFHFQTQAVICSTFYRAACHNLPYGNCHWFILAVTDSEVNMSVTAVSNMTDSWGLSVITARIPSIVLMVIQTSPVDPSDALSLPYCNKQLSVGWCPCGDLLLSDRTHYWHVLRTLQHFGKCMFCLTQNHNCVSMDVLNNGWW